MVKKVFVKSLAFFLFISLVQPAAGQETLRIASDEWPPFTSKDPHQSVATNIVETALENIGYNCSVEIIDQFDDVLKGIEKGTYDGSAALWLETDRQDYIMFSKPYLKNQLILVAKKGTHVSSISNVWDLKGKRVGLVKGYSYGVLVDKKHKVKWVRGEDDQANLTALLQNKLDYMLVDGLLIQYLLLHQKEDVETHLELGNVLISRSLYFGIGKGHPKAEEIIEAFNKEVLSMMNDGTFHNLLNINWFEMDVDGDGELELVAKNNSVGNFDPEIPYEVWFKENEYKEQKARSFVVDGQEYHNWDAIPSRYKVAPVQSEELSILKFSF